ncbi:uroporphyrinogen-III synthase [Flavobacterium sp.]|jgi:uroporphyrinogen-III synthase|uniref:uroporphyrinogen-III synthase n=1 Tax=Flavobacterium sp. TaxID=239 RepID=UPI002A81DD28|nr:uroporphyrinogen-III synthase [Flavobacterium sp.]
MNSILSTKKLSENHKQMLLDHSISLIEENFIETKTREFELANINQNLIFTSQNAVLSLLQNPNWETLKSKPVFCVGLKTKELLTEKGFDVIAFTGYAADLAEIISLIYAQATYTFFTGNLRRDILPNTLKENEIKFNEIEVYETNLISKKITSKIDGILFFSPSAVESYLTSNTIKDQMCFCIGESTSEALENKKIHNIIIAEKPSVENVINDVLEHYQ